MTQPVTTTGALSLVDLVKDYGAEAGPAVDRIDLTIEPGQFTTLLGPSGSGKTTTLNMIAGFLAPTSGQILLDGKDLTAVAPHRRNFGMVFQDYALFPHMTVADNIAFPLRQRKVPKAEAGQKIVELAERFALGAFLDRKPEQLSGGQQQRVALARALVFSPDLLLLDEPLGALDRKLRQSLQAEMRRLHQDLGMTFVFVTHDQDEAMFLSDRIAVFNRGRIERYGAPSELYDDPGTLFVATFLGEANVFTAETAGARSYRWEGTTLRVGERSPSEGDVLIVRPEYVRVVAEAPQDAQTNAVPAVVTDVVRLGGGATRIDFQLDGGNAGAAVIPAKEQVTVRVGDRAHASWGVHEQAFVTA